eukprot:EC118218.1.p1 GENE.EC118218.1~~EC118218.1.p1  ORF type:complete len:132 (-),score=1.94 EC118218.1:20-415(-)
MTSLILRTPTENSTQTPSESISSCGSVEAGGTILPTFLSTKRSPGLVDEKRFGTTRESLQATKRESGFYPLASSLKRPRSPGSKRRRKSNTPSTSFLIVFHFRKTCSPTKKEGPGFEDPNEENPYLREAVQ